MSEKTLFLGLIITGIAIIALNARPVWRWWTTRAERAADPWAEYDKAPARPIAAEPAFRSAPRFTDKDGRPRLPSTAEITSELEALRDPEPETELVPVLTPTAVYEPRQTGPAPHEWTWWAGRWWPPTSLEESLGTNDWLRALLAAV